MLVSIIKCFHNCYSLPEFILQQMWLAIVDSKYKDHITTFLSQTFL